MSKRVAVAFAALLAAAVAAFGGAASAFADGTATPLSPDDASALVGTSGSSTVLAVTAVDPTTALAAASAPGAVTSYESDMTLDQAVGVVSTTDGGASLGDVGSPSTTCWTATAKGQWGTWPYEQKLADTTYWCAVYGSKVTYRSSSVTGGGTLCGLSWRASQLIGGGVGYPSFTMRSTGGFSCPTTIPWIVLHPTHYMDVRHTDVGGATVVGSG